MTKIELLVVIAVAAIACSSEVEDAEQKKRGAGKTTSLNAIPTGAQKTDYTYNLYPSSQSNQALTYQSQVPNSFYPSQNSQYYAPNIQPEQTGYPQQPPINLIPPATPSQFVPLNFIPNPGYQAKYQIVPSKTSNGNIQLAILQQPSNYQSPILQYPQTLYQPNPTNQFQPQQNLLSVPQGHFNVPNYQPLSLGNSYLGQPSPMLLVAQPNPSLYNNLLYPNPLQNIYNYYPSSSQAKYGAYATSSPQTVEYEKIQTPQQAISKEDNDIGSHNTDYISASDSSYKNAYPASRGSSYTKL